jgi:hypothetical protein
MVLKDLDIAMVTMALASMLNVQTIGMSDENLAPVFRYHGGHHPGL